MFQRFLFSTVALVLGAMLLAPLHASALTTTDTCTDAGVLAELLIRTRDLGVPLSSAMQSLDRLKAKYPDPHADAFRRWMTLFVYDMSAVTDTAWIRNRVELKCFQTFQP